MAVDPHLIAQIKAHIDSAINHAALAEMQAALEDTYKAGYVGGVVTAQMVLGQTPDAAMVKRPLLAASKLVDDPGLKGLLDDAGVTIKSIAENRLNVLASTLADGINDGVNMAQMAEMVGNVLDDPRWADLVAVTETNRAVSAGSLQTYQINDVPGKTWLVAADPCELCQENADAGFVAVDDSFPSGDDAPPAHPMCRCAVSPAWPDGSEAGAGEDEGD